MRIKPSSSYIIDYNNITVPEMSENKLVEKSVLWHPWVPPSCCLPSWLIFAIPLMCSSNQLCHRTTQSPISSLLQSLRISWLCRLYGLFSANLSSSSVVSNTILVLTVSGRMTISASQLLYKFLLLILFLKTYGAI